MTLPLDGNFPLIFFYEWEIAVKWKGHANGKGTEATVLKEMLRKGPGAKKVRELLSNYVLALKNEYSSGLILPKKDQAAAPVKTSAVSKPATKTAGGQANEASMKALDIGCKLDLAG